MKKLMSILLAMALLGAITVTNVFAYDTDVIYSATLESEIDVDGDGETDGDISDETPFLLIVPDEITVDGAEDTVYIAGIVDTAVTVTVPEVVDLSDTAGNDLSANLDFGDGSLVLPISLTEVGRNNAEIKAEWINAPMSGSWTGNFLYSIS